MGSRSRHRRPPESHGSFAGGGYVGRADGMSGVRFLAALVIGIGLAGSAGPSAAQDARIRAGGMIRVDPGFARGVPQRINRGEAVRIARSLGMQDVNTIRRTGRQWRLGGADRRGRSMRVVISSVTGEVLRSSRR